MMSKSHPERYQFHSASFVLAVRNGSSSPKELYQPTEMNTSVVVLLIRFDYYVFVFESPCQGTIPFVALVELWSLNASPISKQEDLVDLTTLTTNRMHVYADPWVWGLG